MATVDTITLQRLALTHSYRFDALPVNRAGQVTREQARDLRRNGYF